MDIPSYKLKIIPDAEIEEVFEEDNQNDMETYAEYSEDSQCGDQELEEAVETIDESFTEPKLSTRQIYSREPHLLPVVPRGVSDSHLKYGSNRQVNIPVIF